MGVIAVDSSGTFEDPPIWVVAMKKVNVQKHTGLCISESKCSYFEKNIGKNWREKIAAAFIFKCVEPLIKSTDIVQIDNDFLGWRQDYVERNVKRLFGKKFYGKSPLSNPKIQFIPAQYSDDVQIVHDKTQWARHKGIRVDDDPDLTELLKMLE